MWKLTYPIAAGLILSYLTLFGTTWAVQYLASGSVNFDDPNYPAGVTADDLGSMYFVTLLIGGYGVAGVIGGVIAGLFSAGKMHKLLAGLGLGAVLTGITLVDLVVNLIWYPEFYPGWFWGASLSMSIPCCLIGAGAIMMTGITLIVPVEKEEPPKKKKKKKKKKVVEEEEAEGEGE